MLMHLLDAGDHVVASDDMYGGTFRLFDKVFKRQGLSFSFVDMRDPKNVEAAITPRTKMVWVETPTNPMLKLVDLVAVAEICKKKGVTSVCDNTFMTPYFQKPLALGIDVVAHSTTKYLNGHSDSVGGFVCTNDKALADRIYFTQNAVGGVAAPFDSFLVLRGVKTLHVRMKQHQENAGQIAQFLLEHPKATKVNWPGLSSHPPHALPNKQIPGFGGIMTFQNTGGLEPPRRFLKTVKIFACAESLGGVESLIEHPAIMTHASIPPANREKLGITDGFIRLSVGIEDAKDLIDDLKQALEQA
jgi:cystathionine gamma-lyase